MPNLIRTRKIGEDPLGGYSSGFFSGNDFNAQLKLKESRQSGQVSILVPAIYQGEKGWEILSWPRKVEEYNPSDLRNWAKQTEVLPKDPADADDDESFLNLRSSAQESPRSESDERL